MFHRSQLRGGKAVRGAMMEGMSPAQRADGRRRTPSTDIERELVSAAEQVLVREGPAGITVRAVAAEAGIAPMGVYSRLGGKDGLIDALLIRGFDRLRAAIAGGAEPDPLARLRACGLRYREFALANPHFYAIMFEAPLGRERDSPEVAEHATAAFGALVQNVSLAAAAGQIRAPDPVEAAQQLWSAVHGATTLELKDLVQTPDPGATYQAMIDMTLRGLAG
jgi:AcrR family transcriptional regulator